VYRIDVDNRRHEDAAGSLGALPLVVADLRIK
jgi:hypothetical protein